MNIFANTTASALGVGRFDPSNAEASWTLPADWYYDAEIYRLEHERIFSRTWSYQCHVSDVARPGDFYAGEVLDQGIFIIRDKLGELRAFFNVCSHRAHPLLEGQGNVKIIACPYHQWCYQSDGKFRGARGKQALKDWIPDNADLKPIRVEVYGGLVFVNLDPAAIPLIEQAPKLFTNMYSCCPRLDELVKVKRVERRVAANWKTIVDNNHECYHCAVNHKSLMEVLDYDNKALWSDAGIAFAHMIEHKTFDGNAYPVSEESVVQESLFAFIFPACMPLFFAGPPGLVMFQVVPLGPEESLIRHDFYVLDREPTAQTEEFMHWVTEILAPEDMGLCEKVQKGLHSNAYRQGKFVVDRGHLEFSEHHVHFFQSLVHKAMLG